MKANGILAGALLLAVGACGPKATSQQPQNVAQPANAAASPVPAPEPPFANNEVAIRPAPLSELKGSIDPQSVEAAGQVVQQYGALIEQGRWTQGWKLWSSSATAKAFERHFRDYSDVHLEIGDPGDAEGAAGSIYVTVPAIFYGDLKSGGTARLASDVILRRVNDVPGSTEAQRRWHIERIELTP